MSRSGSSSAERTTGSPAWTPEEDAQLKAAVAERGQSRKTIKWQSIARQFSNKTSQECRKRWYYHSSQPLRRGPWSREEDTKLCLGVRQFGTRWIKVAELVGSRNGDQCYKRWTDSLDPQIDKSPWTAEEDTILLESVQTMGRNWKEIVSARLPYRTGLAAKNRHSLLQRQIQNGQLAASNHSDESEDGSPPASTNPHSPDVCDNVMSDWSAHKGTPCDHHEPSFSMSDPYDGSIIGLDSVYWDVSTSMEQVEFLDNTDISTADSFSTLDFQAYSTSASTSQDWHSANGLFSGGDNTTLLDWEQSPRQHTEEPFLTPQGQSEYTTRDVILKATCYEGHAEFAMEEMAKLANGLTLGGRVKNFSFSAQ
ncbi:hypothetical protein F5Y08DRAFT_335928 [Xylaria arbuscula]|nr:hypothetical protein F5Y08DRAFT_335928 [Xylaria arbuscula]